MDQSESSWLQQESCVFKYIKSESARAPRKLWGLPLFFLLLSVATKCVDGYNINGELNSHGDVWLHFVDVLMCVTLLGALLSRKKLRKIWKKFWLTVDVYELFEKRFQHLIVRFEICQENARTLRKCLWLRLKGNVRLLDWVEPEIRVESFFLNVERDMK